MIAALYVDPKGIYAGRPDVECWGLPERDAREYAGPWPVVAHPPCARWCRLAGLVEHRYPHIKRGEDDGCFAAALASVREWGGVLEHPAYSDAFAAHGLPIPSGGWQRTLGADEWVCEVQQRNYGHRARKATWLFGVGIVPPSLNWRKRRSAVYMSWLTRDGRGREFTAPCVERMGRKERNATPPAFAETLLSIARSARRAEA